MKKLWESDSFVDENTLTVNVNRLRKKLDAIGAKNMIATKHGIGYILQSESNKQEQKKEGRYDEGFFWTNNMVHKIP